MQTRMHRSIVVLPQDSAWLRRRPGPSWPCDDERAMSTEDRVFIAGAGPVGLSAAAALVRQGVPVTVFEGAGELSRESRASTFHPSTLDMLDDLGLADALVATGLVAPRVQYRTRHDGVIAAFDFAGDRRRHAPSLPAAERAAQSHPHHRRAGCAAIRATGSSSTAASSARGRMRTASR